jgi:hypothetical protein
MTTSVTSNPAINMVAMMNCTRERFIEVGMGQS